MKRTLNLLVLVAMLALTLGAGGITTANAAPSTDKQGKPQAAFAQNPAYVRGAAGNAWGVNDNPNAMDTVFGAGNWDELAYETVNPSILFSTAYDFIFMDGGANNDNPMNTFIAANQSLMESWVANGGRLYLNSGGWNISVNFGFGGVTANHSYDSSYSHNVSAVDGAHPIFNGPFLPAGTSYTGDAFAHDNIIGGTTSPIMTGEGGVVLAETGWGNGWVIFGGTTAPFAWSPDPNGANLLANILSYMANGGGTPPTNLLKKPDFANATVFPSPWRAFGFKPPYARALDCTYYNFGPCSVSFGTGNRAAFQQVNRTGVAGDMYAFGMYSASQNAPIGGDYRIELSFFNNLNKPVGKMSLYFNPLTHGFELANGEFGPTGNYNKIIFRFIYNNPSGRAWFDDAFLYFLGGP